MNQPLISIIVPVYNVEKYLNQCVDSILAQTYTNLEIILVNDGSKDNCGAICDAYAQRDNRIIVLHKTNGGLSDARNAGINIAKGEYIGFVDSDDWIEPDMYEYLFNAINQSGADISACGLFREYKDKTVKCARGKDFVYPSELALERLLENSDFQDYAVTKLYNRKLWTKIRFPIGKYYEDMLTTYRLFLQSTSIASVSRCLYHYRQRKGSIVKNGFNDVRIAYLEAAESFLKNPELKKRYSDTIDLRILKVKYQLLWELFLFGDKSALHKYRNQANEWYKSIRQNKHKILKSPNMSNMIKQFARFSFLNYDTARRIFKIKLLQHRGIKYYD